MAMTQELTAATNLTSAYLKHFDAVVQVASDKLCSRRVLPWTLTSRRTISEPRQLILDSDKEKAQNRRLAREGSWRELKVSPGEKLLLQANDRKSKLIYG